MRIYQLVCDKSYLILSIIVVEGGVKWPILSFRLKEWLKGLSCYCVICCQVSLGDCLSDSLFLHLNCWKCFVCWSSWKKSAGWQRMKELPGSSLILSSRHPTDSLRRPPSPALPSGLRPAQGPLCDVGWLIKANASCIPRPSFPLSLYLSQHWLRVRAARELGFTLLTQTVSLFASLAKPWVVGGGAARGVCVCLLLGFYLSIFHSNQDGLIWKYVFHTRKSSIFQKSSQRID